MFFSGRRVLTRDYLLDQTQGKAAPSFDRSMHVPSVAFAAVFYSGRFSLLKTLRNGGDQFAAHIDARRGPAAVQRQEHEGVPS